MVDSIPCIDAGDHGIHPWSVGIYVSFRDYFLAGLIVNFKMKGDGQVFADSGSALNALVKPEIF